MSLADGDYDCRVAAIHRYNEAVRKANKVFGDKIRRFEEILLKPAYDEAIFGAPHELHDWMLLLPGECVDLKAGLLEYALRFGPCPCAITKVVACEERCRLRKLAKAHVKLCNDLYLLKIAKQTLSLNDNTGTSVHTAWQLLREYV